MATTALGIQPAPTDEAKSLLDSLLAESRLYSRSRDYVELLDFVVKLRNFAPFNAMLLQIQKPGLSYAATAHDWHEKFSRRPKQGARPLLILWPFGPVVLVYDVLDTEGKDLPQDVMSAFFAKGTFDAARITLLPKRLERKRIDTVFIDAGDHQAGSIVTKRKANTAKEWSHYELRVNKNHTAAIQLITFAHELAHLCLGHLGKDSKLNIPDRHDLSDARREIEAESVAYLVGRRRGITAKSESYLSRFVHPDSSVDDIDVYQVLRAAGQVESLLGLAGSTTVQKARRKDTRQLAVDFRV